LGGAGILTAKNTFASWGNGKDNMSQELSQKLGVDESKVSDAMDQIQ
jgi:hypothetical protein